LTVYFISSAVSNTLVLKVCGDALWGKCGETVNVWNFDITSSINWRVGVTQDIMMKELKRRLHPELPDTIYFWYRILIKRHIPYE